MSFYLGKNFSQISGIYGDIFWCGYIGDETVYVAKKLKVADFGLELEREAALRFSNLPTIYDVIGIEIYKDEKYLVSKFVPGVALAEYYSSNMENIFLHILCTIEIMGQAGVCHNDLHARNIIITKSDLTHITYCFGDNCIRVVVNGYLPVLIDFGLATINNFKYKPMITGLSMGNLASLKFDNRFDKLRLYYVFHELLDPGNLQLIVKALGKNTSKQISKWIRKNSDQLWENTNAMLEHEFKTLNTIIDFHTSGIFLSFPEINLPSYDVMYECLQNLEAFPNLSCITNDKIIDALDEGPTHPMFDGFSILGQLLRNGVNEMLEKFNQSLESKLLNGLPLDDEVIKYIIKNTPKHVYSSIACQA